MLFLFQHEFCYNSMITIVSLITREQISNGVGVRVESLRFRFVIFKDKIMIFMKIARIRIHKSCRVYQAQPFDKGGSRMSDRRKVELLCFRVPIWPM